MRALRVVGITEGGGEFSVVLEDPARHERFTVPADEQLRAAARGDLSRLGQIAIELESQLRPREIQARIRAGASVEQVAAAAGVPLQKIERFAYPVLLERSRTAEVAQRAHPLRADGPDYRTLGDVVAHTFGLRGQDYSEAEWDSWKGEDGKWVVALSWKAGRSDNRAHWTFQPGAHGGTAAALDEHASDLIEGLPARPLRTVGPVIDMTRPEGPAPDLDHDSHEEQRAAAVGNGRGRFETPREHVPPPEVSRPAPERPIPERPAPERPAARTSETRRPAPPAQRQSPGQPPAQTAPHPDTPTPAEPIRQRAATPEPAAEPVPASAAPTEPIATTPAATPAASPTQPAPVQPGSAEPGPAEPEPAAADETASEPVPPAQQPAASKRTKKGKPVMPSWDEVLLGVRGQR